MSPKTKQQSDQPPVLKSGSYLMSGHYLLSGLGGPLGATGGGPKAMAGELWSHDEAARFQLAPRLYVLTMGDVPSAGDLTAPLDEIPAQLEFRPDTRVRMGTRRQIWSTECMNRWNWQLVVELMEDVVAGRLTAAPPPSATHDLSLSWRSERPWDFFGRNELRPDFAVSQRLPMVLFAAAP